MYFEDESLLPEIYQPAAEVFQTYQVTHEFYQEVQYREAFQQHCQWYTETAQRHQQELEKMRGDFNLFGWFSRQRRRG